MISTEPSTAALTAPEAVLRPPVRVATVRSRGASPRRRQRTLAALVAFDPVEVGRLEADAWAAYYRHRWVRFARLGLRCARHSFGLSWPDTLRCAWLVTRANQLWAPYPVNDAAGAEAVMRRVYALLARRYGVPADPATAAARDVAWWRVHRELQYGLRADADSLVAALVDFWQQVYPVPAETLTGAATERRLAMVLSDRWIREGRRADSRLLAEIRAALIASYTQLARAVSPEAAR